MVSTTLLPKPNSSASSVPITIPPGSRKGWHVLLLICRALSVVPVGWWGIQCALTFLRELLPDGEALSAGGALWDAEKRFRVTETFLAVLWVNCHLLTHMSKKPLANRIHVSVLHRLTYVSSSPTASCPGGRSPSCLACTNLVTSSGFSSTPLVPQSFACSQPIFSLPMSRHGCYIFLAPQKIPVCFCQPGYLYAL